MFNSLFNYQSTQTGRVSSRAENKSNTPKSSEMKTDASLLFLAMNKTNKPNLGVLGGFILKWRATRFHNQYCAHITKELHTYLCLQAYLDMTPFEYSAFIEKESSAFETLFTYVSDELYKVNEVKAKFSA